MQTNSKLKKYTHSRMKACLGKAEEEDKENLLYFEDFRNKKLSVELPSRCQDVNDNHQKSIFNEQISVTLNTSNPKGSTFDRDIITVDVKTLSHLLSKQRNSVPLKEILAESDLKSIEVKLLVERILSYLRKEEKVVNTSMISQNQGELEKHSELSQTLMRPYLQKEIDVLSKNLEKLVQQREDYISLKNVDNENKFRLLNAMKEMYQCQMRELTYFNE